jgi:hypothetical protein
MVLAHSAISKDAHKAFMNAADVYIFTSATIICFESWQIQSFILPDSHPVSISADTPPWVWDKSMQ